MTDRIDHAAEARKHIDWAHDWQEREGDTEEAGLATAVLAQAHATLALVEQARIANLVGLLKDTFASHQALEALSDVATAQSGQLISLRPDIAAALGIETGAGDE